MRYGLLLPALLAGLAGLAGCTDDDIGLVIEKIVGVETPDCVADPGSNIIRTRGTLDVGLVQAGTLRGYTLTPVVKNNLLVPVGTGTTLETNTITVTGFDVELNASPNDDALNAALAGVQSKFYVPSAAGRLPPGGVSSVAALVEVIPRDIANVMGLAITTQGLRSVGPLLVHVRPVGQRASLKLNGGFIDFPVDVCKFCLTPVPAPCPATGFPADQIQAGGCFPQQDSAVTCCTSGSTLLCGGAVPKTTTP